MAEDARRKFLKSQIGAGAAFAAGLAGGGVAGATAMHLRRDSPRAEPTQSKHSYAQQGEDLILRNILTRFLPFPAPLSYLDIGAHHPIINNNTYLFYEAGARGVLVEPNPALWELLAGFRRRDVLVRGGIGIGPEREADYYVISGDGQLNTFSKEMAESYPQKSGGRYSIQKVVRMPLVNINELMQEHWKGAPHLLSLDTEGWELPILKSLDFSRFRPPVLCIDTLEAGERAIRTAVLELMASKDYVVRGGTFVNTVFIDRRYTL